MKKNLLTFAVMAVAAAWTVDAENVWEGTLDVSGWETPFVVTLDEAPVLGDVLAIHFENTTNAIGVAVTDGGTVNWIVDRWVGENAEFIYELQVTGPVAQMLDGGRELTFYRGDYTVTSIELHKSEFAGQLSRRTVWFALGENVCSGWGSRTVESNVFANVGVTDKVLFHCSPANSVITLLDGVNYWGNAFSDGQCVDGVYTLDISKEAEPETVVSNLKQWGVIVTGNDFSLNYVDIVKKGSTTGISDAAEENDGGTFDVYSSAGILVRKNVSSFAGLPAGLYISKGRKVVVK